MLNKCEDGGGDTPVWQEGKNAAAPWHPDAQPSDAATLGRHSRRPPPPTQRPAPAGPATPSGRQLPQHPQLGRYWSGGPPGRHLPTRSSATAHRVTAGKFQERLPSGATSMTPQGLRAVSHGVPKTRVGGKLSPQGAATLCICYSKVLSSSLHLLPADTPSLSSLLC